MKSLIIRVNYSADNNIFSFLSEILHVYPIPADRQDLGMTNPRACMLSRQQPGALLAQLLQQVEEKPKPARVLPSQSNDL